jgi:glycosyltransferase involved in cell wall biosynthesis
MTAACAFCDMPDCDCPRPSVGPTLHAADIIGLVESAIGTTEPVTIASRRPVDTVQALLSDPRVVSLVLPTEQPQNERVSHFSSDCMSWVLPAALGSLVFLDASERITFAMVREALRRRVTSIWCVGPTGRRVLQLGRRLPAHLMGGALRRVPAVLRKTKSRRVVEVATGWMATPPLERLLSTTDAALAERPRVVLAVGTLGPGGSERQVANLAAGLSAAGDDCAVTIADGATAQRWFFGPQLVEAKVPVVDAGSPLTWHTIPEVGHERWPGLLGPLFVHEVQAFTRTFRRLKPSVVHAFLDDTNITAGAAALLAGVPHVVLSGRSLAPWRFALHQPHFAAAYRVLLRRQNVRLTNNSAAGAADYAAWLGIDARSIAVIENGVDTRAVVDSEALAFRLQHGFEPNALVVGTVGRLAEEKQPFVFLDVVARLGNTFPDARFVHVGTGPLDAAVKQRARELGLEHRLLFLGLKRDVAVALRAFDVFLLTSRAEGFSNVLVEAQQQGCPVVSTDCGGARETFVAGQSGTLVSVGDVSALAEAAAHWARQARTTALRSQIADDARRRFSVERMVSKTRALYGELGPASSW